MLHSFVNTSSTSTRYFCYFRNVTSKLFLSPQMMHQGIGHLNSQQVNYTHTLYSVLCTLYDIHSFTYRWSLYGQLLVKGECVFLKCQYTITSALFTSELEEAIGFSKVFQLLVDGKKVS